jgi:RND family efflux transporter MFP subunit
MEQAQAAQAAAPTDAAISAALTSAQEAYSSAEKSNGEAQAAAAAAQSAHSKAVQNLDNTLYNDNRVWQNALDSLNMQKQQDSTVNLQNELKKLEKNLEYTTIKAPVSGTVTSVTAEVGKKPGETAGLNALFVIQNMQSLEVPASVPEYDVNSLTNGMKVEITADALENESWQGTVKSISPVASDANGNFTVLIGVDSLTNSLRPGMSAKLSIIAITKTDVFAVPVDAVVVNANGEKIVYAYEPDVSQIGQVEPPGRGDTGEVRSFNDPEGGGQDAGNEVVTSGETIVSGGRPNAPDPQSGGTRTGPRQGAGQGITDGGRIEIPVTTGMETDYYVEISGAGLREGMQIIIDPNGVYANSEMNMGGNVMMGGPDMSVRRG